MAVKRWLARHMLIIEFCKRCGIEQPIVWHTDDELWLKVTGSPDGVLCPKCFSRRAREFGVYVEWTPTEWNP